MKHMAVYVSINLHMVLAIILITQSKPKVAWLLITDKWLIKVTVEPFLIY